LRRWRQGWFERANRLERKAFFNTLKHNRYDVVLDAQGLLKSAWVARKIKSPIAGYDWQSAREPLATLFYQFKYPIAKDQHAILRLRQLFAQSLHYALPDNPPIVYGLDTQAWSKPENVVSQFSEAPYWVFLHGTTWDTKYWPEDHWIELLQKANALGVKVILPWGNEEEFQRAQRFATRVDANQVWVPKAMLSLNEMAKVLKHAQAVVSVDTGLSHVAAALDVPMVVLYRVTDPKLVGADGTKVIRLASPCAPDYIKVFSGEKQALESLQGLGVETVLNHILDRIKQ
jgi:heptosyltransferase-1